MHDKDAFDLLERFTEIERLVAKIYFRFSHLFLHQQELRDFWWEMAKEEEQHGSILSACKAIIENYEEKTLDPSINPERANELKNRLLAYLDQGTLSLGVEEAFRIALDIEGLEIDVIYGKLLRLAGANIAQTLANVGLLASSQRQKLKLAVRRFCTDPGLLSLANSI